MTIELTQAALNRLVKGRALLLQDGWLQGDYVSDGRYCTIGALCNCCGSADEKAPDTEAAYRAIDESLAKSNGAQYASRGYPLSRVIEWNDNPSRTKGDVIAAFDAAINATEAKLVNLKLTVILKGAVKLLREKRWTQGAYARTADGKACDVRAAGATCFCSIGAIERHIGHDAFTLEQSPYRSRAMSAVLNQAGDGGCNLAEWNDSLIRTRDQVIGAFDKAIATLEAA